MAESGKWQPIETAPKLDAFGSYVLVYAPGPDGIDLAWWDDGKGIHPNAEPCWRSATLHDEMGSAAIEPTHWMPLEPPK